MELNEFYVLLDNPSSLRSRSIELVYVGPG